MRSNQTATTNLRLLIFLIFAAIQTNCCAQSAPLLNGFAHNDYRHKHPLFDALDNGYTNIEAAQTVSELARRLDIGAVDAILANQLVFDWNIAIAGIPGTKFASITNSENGVGVYFSNNYLAAHPAFLDRFNAEATDCRMNAHLFPDH